MKLIQCIIGLSLIALTACKQEKKNEENKEEKPLNVAIEKESKIATENSIIKKSHQVYKVKKALSIPKIDGENNDESWQAIEWRPLDQLWLGKEYSKQDFEGKYKLTWNKDALYLLVSITDDVLYDQHKDPKQLWWDDDCVEIFIDADNSGGKHLDTHNAFAYHVALDHNVIDMSTKKEPILFNDHVKTAHITTGNTTIWEHKIYLFEEASFKENEKNTPLQLKANNKIGFALAYCDNDGSKERENFIGSTFVAGEDKNQGYINADIFDTIQLIE